MAARGYRSMGQRALVLYVQSAAGFLGRRGSGGWSQLRVLVSKIEEEAHNG